MARSDVKGLPERADVAATTAEHLAHRPSGQKDQAGGIIVEANADIWMVESGTPGSTYELTFPKGRVATGEDAQSAAGRQVREKTGLQMRAIGHIEYHESPAAITRYFLAPHERSWAEIPSVERAAARRVPLLALPFWVTEKHDRSFLPHLVASDNFTHLLNTEGTACVRAFARCSAAAAAFWGARVGTSPPVWPAGAGHTGVTHASDECNRIPTPVRPIGSTLPMSLEGLVNPKPLGGSTGATLLEEVERSRRYVVKRGAHREQCISEFYMGQVYLACGVRVPRSCIISTPTGEVLLSEYIVGRSVKEVLAKEPFRRAKIFAEVASHFAIDALLGNWDVTGKNFCNLLVDHRGAVWRIDHGCGFQWRAQGEFKGDKWSNRVHEIKDMCDGRKSPYASQICGTITPNDLALQIKRLIAIRTPLLEATPRCHRQRIAARLEDMQRQHLTKAH